MRHPRMVPRRRPRRPASHRPPSDRRPSPQRAMTWSPTWRQRPLAVAQAQPARVAGTATPSTQSPATARQSTCHRGSSRSSQPFLIADGGRGPGGQRPAYAEVTDATDRAQLVRAATASTRGRRPGRRRGSAPAARCRAPTATVLAPVAAVRTAVGQADTPRSAAGSRRARPARRYSASAAALSSSTDDRPQLPQPRRRGPVPAGVDPPQVVGGQPGLAPSTSRRRARRGWPSPTTGRSAGRAAPRRGSRGRMTRTGHRCRRRLQGSLQRCGRRTAGRASARPSRRPAAATAPAGCAARTPTTGVRRPPPLTPRADRTSRHDVRDARRTPAVRTMSAGGRVRV